MLRGKLSSKPLLYHHHPNSLSVTEAWKLSQEQEVLSE